MQGEQRIELAQALLAEAVFASRAKQAAGASLMQGAGCGLGTRAEVALELSPRAAQIARELWPRELSAAELESVRQATAEWVEQQDALDRKRNHFLKDFRARHGFDRNAYSPEQLAAFEQGLAHINAEVEQRRRAAAARLP
jgi:hypothetical protein